MPVRNEKRTIVRNLKVITEAMGEGLVDYAALTLDAPSDGTRELVLRALGRGKDLSKTGLPRTVRRVQSFQDGKIIVVEHARPNGKGTSVVHALQALREFTPHFDHPNAVSVHVDADALDLKVEYLVAMAAWTKLSLYDMLLGRHWEKLAAPIERDGFSDTQSMAGKDQTGFRAIKASALLPILNCEGKGVLAPAHLGFDAFLNHLISPGQVEVPLFHETFGRHVAVSDQHEQNKVLQRVLAEPAFAKRHAQTLFRQGGIAKLSKWYAFPHEVAKLYRLKRR